MTFTWITVLTTGLAGFFGAGSVSLWRAGHRFGAGVIAALALVCLAFAIISVIPGSTDA